MFKENKKLIALVIVGLMLFATITVYISSSNSTTNAVVPTQDIPAGTVVEESMVSTIDVPSKTPKGYITSINSIVGQKLKTSLNKGQLIYSNSVASSWQKNLEGYKIPKDYVVTSIQIPTARAVGGLVSIGDSVDILGVPNSNYLTSDMSVIDQGLGDIAKNKYQANGVSIYWVLSNVKILDTNAVNLNGSISGNKDKAGTTSNSSGAYYVVALSYSDYQRLRLAQNYLDFWMNIVPQQNSDHNPLINEMGGHPEVLTNAQAIKIANATANNQKDTHKVKKNN